MHIELPRSRSDRHVVDTYPVDIQAAIDDYKTTGRFGMVMGPLTAANAQQVISITNELARIDQINNKYRDLIIACAFITVMCMAFTTIILPIIGQIIIACLLFIHLFRFLPYAIYTLDLTYLIYILCVAQQPGIIALASVSVVSSTATMYMWCQRVSYTFDDHANEA